MKTNWFKPWGWCYRPTHPVGYVVALGALAFCLNTFCAIDRQSHSAADTLYRCYPFAAPTFLGLMWIAARTSHGTKD
jgi:hypothetical protein